MHFHELVHTLLSDPVDLANLRSRLRAGKAQHLLPYFRMWAHHKERAAAAGVDGKVPLLIDHVLSWGLFGSGKSL